MLEVLQIRDLALIDELSLELGPGLNVLTGETGAGKSIIVSALSLLRGAKGERGLVRSGAREAVVSAQFRPPAGSGVGVTVADAGLVDPDEELESLVVTRRVPVRGRGRCVAQGALTTQGVMRALGSQLVEICGQHEHHSLTEPSRQLALVDGFAGHPELVGGYIGAYESWVEATTRLAAARERVDEGPGRAAFLEYQLDELSALAPEVEEYQQLERSLSLWERAAHYRALAEQLRGELYEDDDALSTRLAQLGRSAGEGAQASERFEEIASLLQSAQVACEEAGALAASVCQGLEIDDEALGHARARADGYRGLMHKHGMSGDELAGLASRLEAELDTVRGGQAAVERLEQEVERNRAQCVERATILLAARRRAAKRLATQATKELRTLAMPNGRLSIELSEMDPKRPNARGIGGLVFGFSANQGEPMAALGKVASGGELSRLLLAIKTRLAEGASTCVFDEVDTGVGGAAADAVGRCLARVAQGRQVLVVTHLPQIAAFADRHFRVEKRVSKGRTSTRAVLLDDEARIDELARMLGGSRHSAREHAAGLISDAQASAPRKRKRRRAA